VPWIGHQVQSVLSPPIRRTGACPGASARTSATRTGLTAPRSPPLYWLIARYSAEMPTKPAGIG
jgi:hypothetical protein